MCGLAGIARRGPGGVSAERLVRMADAIRHRGPDGAGLHADERVGLSHVRLSVIDLARGAQPMAYETGTVFVVYNGEIFNHLAPQREVVEDFAVIDHEDGACLVRHRLRPARQVDHAEANVAPAHALL